MARRLSAEFIGFLLLAACVIGSGIMGERLAGGNTAIALLANTLATVTVLAVLISSLGPVSGAHFNPVVTATAVYLRRLDPSTGASYVVTQMAGCAAGAMLANAMIELPLFEPAMHARSGAAFAGIRPADVPGFIAAQLVGGIVGVLMVRALEEPREPA